MRNIIRIKPGETINTSKDNIVGIHVESDGILKIEMDDEHQSVIKDTLKLLIDNQIKCLKRIEILTKRVDRIVKTYR